MAEKKTRDRQADGRFAEGNRISKGHGAPALWESAEKMQEAIEAYFTGCEGKPCMERGADGEEVAVRDKCGQPVIAGAKPPTITGLALALGFNSRQALLNYQHKDVAGTAGYSGFDDTIRRAKARVEAYAEERLFDKDGANGAKFSLANNFCGWKEKNETALTGPGGGAFEVNIRVVD